MNCEFKMSKQKDCQTKSQVAPVCFDSDMFESIVATVLNQVLGKYVDNLEQKDLKLGIFSGSYETLVILFTFLGNVVLKNLKLKKEAVDKLNLPIEVFEGNIEESGKLYHNLLGFLGSLELRIPWANLKTQPVRVLIGDLFVLAGPRSETEVSQSYYVLFILFSMTQWLKKK